MKKKLDYNDTKSFFENRAKKYNSDAPYVVTMLQDNNTTLVEKRNEYETKKLLNFMNINSNSKILDLACGIGRWADAIGDDINSYYGVDFSEGLISIAKSRHKNDKMHFLVGSSTDVASLLDNSMRFSNVFIVAFLIYLNDEDVLKVFTQAEMFSDKHAIICIREIIGITDRLTLKDFYSEELKAYYNAVYRTDKELKEMMSKTLFNKGFRIIHEGFLFDDIELNNRKETSQYYYILER